MKNKVTVELCDKEYSLLTEEGEDYVKSLAKEINQMIEKTAYASLRLSKADATVLSCLDLCDQNRKLRSDNDNMRKEIMMHIEEIGELNRRILAYERQKSGKSIKNIGADEIFGDDMEIPQTANA